MILKKLMAPGRFLSGLVFSRWRPCNVAAFHLGRSGSRLLGDLLKQNPNIVWDGELLSPGRLDGIAGRWPLLPRSPLAVLRLRMALAGKRCYGFETQPPQVEYLDITLHEYIEKLEKLQFHHFLLLERKNHLRRIVSMLVARENSQWHLHPGEVAPPTRIELDVDGLQLNRGRDTQARSLVEQLEREQQTIDALERTLRSRSFLYLSYEDDLETRPQVAYERVCEFINVPAHPVQVRFAKTNPRKLSEIVVNFSQVERALNGTAFQWMLDS